MNDERLIKLEAMLLHLLHTKTVNGKTWAAITVPDVARFTRQDVEDALRLVQGDAARARSITGHQSWWMKVLAFLQVLTG
jgi:hypothetical protein